MIVKKPDGSYVIERTLPRMYQRIDGVAGPLEDRLQNIEEWIVGLLIMVAQLEEKK